MLQWYIGDLDPKEELEKAIQRYKVRFGNPPQVILVNQNNLAFFDSIRGDLEVKSDKWMKTKEFGLL